MRDYVCELHFSSDPAAVYKALTSPEGLAGWWTADCDVSPEGGRTIHFPFRCHAQRDKDHAIGAGPRGTLGMRGPVPATRRQICEE